MQLRRLDQASHEGGAILAATQPLCLDRPADVAIVTQLAREVRQGGGAAGNREGTQPCPPLPWGQGNADSSSRGIMSDEEKAAKQEARQQWCNAAIPSRRMHHR